MTDRTAVVALLAPLAVLTYIDRIAISVAGPRIQSEFGLSASQWGWVMGAFVLSYGIFELPSGALGDHIGQRKVLGRTVIWWSTFTALTGATTGYLTLVITRFLFGVGEAGAFPNIAGAISRWFTPREQGRIQGLIWGASRLGGALTPVLVVPTMAIFGWRAAFYVFGAIGFVWAALWFAVYREPEKRLPEHHATDWRGLMRSSQVWRIMLVYFCYVFGPIFFLTWLHTYLVKGRGFSENQMGVLSTAPFLLGAAGCFFGGWLCEVLARRLGVGTSRRLVGTGALLLSSLCMLTTALVPGQAAAIIFLTLGLGIMDCFLPAAWATCTDLGGRYAGAVTGAMNSAGQLGGFICSILYGYLVDRYASYDLPLVVIALMVFVSGLLFWTINPAERAASGNSRSAETVLAS